LSEPSSNARAAHRHRQNSFRERRFIHAAGHSPYQTHLPAHPVNWHYLPMSDHEYNLALAEVGTIRLRKSFIATLCELAGSRRSYRADDWRPRPLGDGALRERFPNRFLNVGVAEQKKKHDRLGDRPCGSRLSAIRIFDRNFRSIAAVRVYPQRPRASSLPVRIVGMGMGFEYGHSGPTHYGVEDVSVLRTLPGLTIVIPADSDQAANAIRDTSNASGPVYYSLGKDDKISVQD